MPTNRSITSPPLLQLLTLAREIAADAASQSDPDRSLRTLRSGLLRLGFKRAGICVIDPNDASMLLGTWGTDFRGREIEEHELVVPVARYIADGLISPGDKIATCRWAPPPTLSEPHASQLPQVDGPPNLAVVALRADGELQGIIQVDMLPGNDSLDESRLAVLEFLADQVAVIIARGRSEARLHEAYAVLDRERATLAAIMSSMDCGFIMIDRGRRITYCNEQAETLLGIQAKDIVGEVDQAVFTTVLRSLGPPVSHWETWTEVVTALLTDRDNRRYEFNFRGSQQRDVLSHIFPVLAAGTVLGVGVMLRDVTALKHVALLRERERIAMDLHDGVIQTLYAAALSLGVDRVPAPEGASGRRPGSDALDLIDLAIRSIRSYVSQLDTRPIRSRLGSELRVLTEQLSASTSIRPSIDVDQAIEAVLTPDALGHVLQIAHEATINVIRHAGAREVVVRLNRVAQTLVLTVADDGCGFDPEGVAHHDGRGLYNMGRRADLLNGSLKVTSAPEKGTEVRLEVPITT